MERSLELVGNFFVLYFEGEPIKEPAALTDGEVPNARYYYAGQARITRMLRQKSRLFNFRTETQNSPHRFESELLLSPGPFESLHGHARTAVCCLMQDNAEPLIDCLAAQVLATIESWEDEELRRKGDWKRILSPPPIVFGALPAELIDEALFGPPVLVFPSN